MCPRGLLVAVYTSEKLMQSRVRQVDFPFNPDCRHAPVAGSGDDSSGRLSSSARKVDTHFGRCIAFYRVDFGCLCADIAKFSVETD